MSTSSRMIYAFARDGGLPYSRVFGKIHVGLDTPVNALLLTTGIVIIFGCIFLGSTAAFNAIVSASVVALGVTYAIPPAINALRGRKMLPETRAFKLPGPLGWFCNIVSFAIFSNDHTLIMQAGVLYTVLTTILFVFPPAIPVSAASMNYCIVAFAIVIVISAIQWIVDGRKNYKGPQIDVAALVDGSVEGLNPAATNDSTNNGGSHPKEKEMRT